MLLLSTLSGTKQALRKAQRVLLSFWCCWGSKELGLLYSISSMRFPKSHLPPPKYWGTLSMDTSFPPFTLVRVKFSARAGCSKGRLPTVGLVWRESGNTLQSWKQRPPPFHLLPSTVQMWLQSAFPWLPGLLPALLLPALHHLSPGHQGGSKDSSGALEPFEGARESDTLV